ncbi:hypothetical protein Vdis_0983 [Vulcanisaeta distributa DSM 14429]|uniref:Uncharacterized protein n=2 Tax=Vulcanisaeta distributa TaxID=164451 RepID=E1QQ01_VULDI|nr:hypothetical protein Vdis_0983 [Vulcanisaeta distributa DSM 14429]
MMGMDLKWKKIGIITIPAVLAIVMITILAAYTMNPMQAYNSLTPAYVFNVVANFSDGGINQTMMQEMIRNTVNSALRGFITLNKPPYPVVNVKLFKNTLVTFQLPSNYRYRYASIVVHNDTLYVYLWNNANNYKLYAIVRRPIASVKIEIIYPREGNFTPVGVLGVEKFSVPLPGLNSADDPEVYFEYYEALWYIGNQLAANTTAAGWFFINLGVSVESILDDGHAQPGFGYALCTTNAPGTNYGVGSIAAQTQTDAGYAFYDCGFTVVLSNWPWVGMDANGNVYYPTSFPGAKSIQAACICTGASFYFQAPPPLPGED